MQCQWDLSSRLQPQHTNAQCWQPTSRFADRGILRRVHYRSSAQSPRQIPSCSSVNRAGLSPSPALRQPLAHARRLLQPLRTVGATQTAAAAVPEASERQLGSAESCLPSTNGPGLSSAVVIIGGGPAGLASALMLARRGYTNIKVYEQLPEPPATDDLSVWGNFEQATERLYMIGLNGRGQAALRDLEVMDRIDQASSLVYGRLDWQPNAPADQPKITRYGATRSYVTRCIQRDRLASCLLEELRAKHGGVVSVEFGVRCLGAEWRESGHAGQEVCCLTLQKQHTTTSSSTTTTTSSTNSISATSISTAAIRTPASEWTEESTFVIGADGAGSSIRTAMEQSSSGSFKVRRYQDKNKIVYRTIPLFWPSELADVRPGDLNYSARTKSGLSLDCLPTREGPMIAVMLYKPGDKRITALKTGDDVRKLFREHLPAFLPAIRAVDFERFAQKHDSNLPNFSFAGPVLHHGTTACLVGDTIHTVKPYFGQGVNSAFEDVRVLQRALEETDDNPSAAVQRFSQLRAKDAESLVVLSHSLDGGFLTFVGPLILDSMLHKLLPRIFSPNIIASLQNEKWSFSQIRARKRVDRVMQVGLLAGLVFVLSRVVVWLLGISKRLIGMG